MKKLALSICGSLFLAIAAKAGPPGITNVWMSFTADGCGMCGAAITATWTPCGASLPVSSNLYCGTDVQLDECIFWASTNGIQCTNLFTPTFGTSFIDVIRVAHPQLNCCATNFTVANIYYQCYGSVNTNIVPVLLIAGDQWVRIRPVTIPGNGCPGVYLCAFQQTTCQANPGGGGGGE